MTRYPYRPLPGWNGRDNTKSFVGENYNDPAAGYYGLWNREFNPNLPTGLSEQTPTPSPTTPTPQPPGIPGDPSRPRPGSPPPVFNPNKPSPSEPGRPVTPVKPGGPGWDPNPIKPPSGGKPTPFPDSGKPNPIDGAPRPGSPTPSTSNPGLPRPTVGNQNEKLKSTLSQQVYNSNKTQVNSTEFPGVPQIYLDQMTRGQDGRLYFGPDMQPVKYENGRLSYDVQPQTFQWEKYKNPINDGFTGVRNGQNFVNGHVWGAEGLNQSENGQDMSYAFDKWLKAHGSQIGGTAASYSGEQSTLANPTGNEQLKGGLAAGIPTTTQEFGPFAPGTRPTNPIARGNEPFQVPPMQIGGTNPLERNSNFMPQSRYRDFITSKNDPNSFGGMYGKNPGLWSYANTGNQPFANPSGAGEEIEYQRNQGQLKPATLADPKGGGVAQLDPNAPPPSRTTPPPGTGEFDYNQPNPDRPRGWREYETDPATGRTPGAEREYDELLNGRDPYGNLRNPASGQQNQQGATWLHDPNADLSFMPDWLRRQYRWEDLTTRENSAYPGVWTMDDQLRDEQGNYVVRVGNRSQAVGGGHSDGSVIDWSRVRYDETLGMVTDPANIRDVTSRSFQLMRAVTLTFIAAGAIYALAGAGGAFATPSGATITPEAMAGFSASGTAGVGTEAAAQAIANIPAGTVTQLSTVGQYIQATIDGVSHVWNSTAGRWVRTAMSLVNRFTGGNNSGRRTNVSGDNNSGVPSWLQDIVGTGVNLYNDNRNIRDFTSRQDELMERGDYNRDFRRGYLNRLYELETNTERALADPTYQALRDRRQGNISRQFAGRGLAISGNEMGELNRQGTEMDYAHLEQQRESLRRSANLGDPGSMSRAAMQNLPFLYRARGERNFDVNRAIQSLLGSGSNSAADALRRLLSGDISWAEIDPDDQEALIGLGVSGDGEFNWEDAISGEGDDYSWIDNWGGDY